MKKLFALLLVLVFMVSLVACGSQKLTMRKLIDANQSKTLLETHDSITSIALECGFENIGYFIRRFTKQTGFSPSEWRKRNKT